MDTGRPESPAHASGGDERLVVIVSRVAFSVALFVMIALPLAYWSVTFESLSVHLAFQAEIKAAALSELVASAPDLWMYQEHRLASLVTHYPIPLETEAAQIYDLQGNLVAAGGETPASPVLNRSGFLYESGQVVGRVDVNDSLREVIYGTGLAALVGMLFAAVVFVALRVVPLRALRRVTSALFAQRERAQVTLHAIGDAVISTDEGERVEYLNPTAQELTGWGPLEASGKPLSEVLQMRNVTTGKRIPSPLRQALAEDRIVHLVGAVDLVRRDASRVAIEDSAAPIHNSSGKIIGGVLVLRDVSAVREATQRNSWEAAHDLLTGLVNRREFVDRVEAAIHGARNSAEHHVICYMDLDQFKVVNDACGHAAGDGLLKEIAGLLQSRIRKSDTLARLGGDEFGLLLDGCSLERAQFISADLLAAVGDYRFKWDAEVFTVGVSIGLATVTGDSTSGADILNMADTACYWAKEQGKNRVCVYRPGDSDMATRRREVSWIARINAALTENRFTLYHQDYLALNDKAGDRKHLEVLIRMIDDEGNLVQPGSFLPAAERYNLMPAIDRWVINTVFAGYHALVAERGGDPLTCAINLSGTSLNAEGFIDFVRQRALEQAMPPQSICFEITETAAINNLPKAAEFIQECKAMGFLFALDDFGMGASSFGYLRNLAVDYIKIDGGFVRNLERDAIDKAMTETINRIGHIMGLKTIAEYAENDAIIEELRKMGVDYAQGYGVCLPIPLFGPALPSVAASPKNSAQATRDIAEQATFVAEPS
jgi:diguanylate cyclase (GGDEF)-like protein/PAS domain S-box-containing protein